MVRACICTSLTNVTIPASVTAIGIYAFSYCSSLTSASFLGDAPFVDWYAFHAMAGGFTVYYFNNKTGFFSPTWNGCPAVNMGDSSPSIGWLLANGMPYDTDLLTDPNGDGVNLLMAYGLNLDPQQNLSGSMPRPQVSGNQLSLLFYAGSGGVIYAVKTLTHLLCAGSIFAAACITANAQERIQVPPALAQPRQPDGNGAVAISGELKQWHKVTLTLDGPFAADGIAGGRWFTPRQGGTLQTGSAKSINGGGSRSVGQAPQDAEADWLAVLRR